MAFLRGMLWAAPPVGGPWPALAAFLVNGLEGPVLVLDHLGDEFLEAVARLLEDGPAGGGGAVVAAPAALDHTGAAAEVAQTFQQVEGGVEGALAEAVAVAVQLLGDLRPVHRPLGRVVKGVQADEAVEEMARDLVVRHDVALRCRVPTILPRREGIRKGSSQGQLGQ
jgi:hypothetical protein